MPTDKGISKRIFSKEGRGNEEQYDSPTATAFILLEAGNGQVKPLPLKRGK